MTKSIDLEPTLSEAFELGRREGLKEAFQEIRKMIPSQDRNSNIVTYIDARLKSIHDFDSNNPFKQRKET